MKGKCRAPRRQRATTAKMHLDETIAKCYFKSNPHHIGVSKYEKTIKHATGPSGGPCVPETPCWECKRFGERGCEVKKNGMKGRCKAPRRKRTTTPKVELDETIAKCYFKTVATHIGISKYMKTTK